MMRLFILMSLLSLSILGNAQSKTRTYRRNLNSGSYEIVTDNADGSHSVKRYIRCQKCSFYQSLSIYASYNIQPGYQLCPICQGRGMSGSIPCVSCGGRIITKCPSCGSDGYQLIGSYLDDKDKFINDVSKKKHAIARLKSGDKYFKTGKTVKKKVLNDKGDKGWYYTVYFTNGQSTLVSFSQCILCKGSGKCTSFKCTNGYIPNVVTGLYTACPSCGGSHKCKTCHGTGMAYNSFMYDSNNSSQSASRGSSGSSSSSRTADRQAETEKAIKQARYGSKGWRRIPCPVCHRGRYNKSYTTTSLGWHEYVNTGGKCDYCGDYGKHYHQWCTNCDGIGEMKEWEDGHVTVIPR